MRVVILALSLSLLCAGCGVAVPAASLLETPADSLPSLSVLKAQAAQAEQNVSSLLQNPRLFMIEGKPVVSPGCQSQGNRAYHFVSLKQQKSATVRFEAVAGARGCVVQRKTSLDDPAGGAGFYFFAVSSVKKAPATLLKKIVGKYPKFEWDGDFQLFQILNPTVKHPGYIFNGTLCGKQASFSLDSVNGEISEESVIPTCDQ